MSNIFKQSIIILKDDALTHDRINVKNDLVRNLIDADNKIKHAYELSMSGETIFEQITNIIKLK